MPLREPNPTGEDLNGSHPLKSRMDLYLEAYGTIGMTLLLSRLIGEPEGPRNAALREELAKACSMLELALIETITLKEATK